jgi:ligand-binding SRPBCC domain-containing protein
MSCRLEFVQWVPYPLEQVFLFFADPRNLPRIMPPERGTRIEHLSLAAPPPGSSHSVQLLQPLAGVGSEIMTSFRIVPPLPFRRRWIARITEFEWNDHFADMQVAGPFAEWLHRHELAADVRNGISGTVVCDRVEYKIGYRVLGIIAQHLFVERQMRAMFAYRQSVLEQRLQESRFEAGAVGRNAP